MNRRTRAVTGAAFAVGLEGLLRAMPTSNPGRWQRSNHRGAPVSLLSGPALALAAGLTGGSAPAAVAALTAAAVGAYDDVAGSADKGLHGHLAALRAGRLTSGVVKVAGLGAVGLVSTLLRPGRRGLPDLLVDAGLVAGSANLLNLFDLRPGRALKVGVVAALALDLPGPLGAGVGLLPGDLGERSMLGDAGANAYGALLGAALAGRVAARSRRTVALGLLVALTAASEVVSYSAVIDATPPLRWVDRLGRLA